VVIERVRLTAIAIRRLEQLEGGTMKQLLEWSGMWIVLVGIVVAITGLIVLIVTEDSWILYAAGYAVVGVGVVVLFWVALRDRLAARKTENLDDVGFN
jgi:cytochrome c biogenesis protein CcdA|tara:strand:+ start:990 stop:1283 length:294 start_codon:yes stop_codon:yes gene_type:complete